MSTVITPIEVADPVIAASKIPAAVEKLTGASVHVATVHRWMLRGVRGVRLASFRVGGRVHVRQSDLRDFLAAIQ